MGRSVKDAEIRFNIERHVRDLMQTIVDIEGE